MLAGLVPLKVSPPLILALLVKLKAFEQKPLHRYMRVKRQSSPW